MDNLKQKLIENIADILDSEDVQREEILKGVSDPIQREESKLHIRMAEAALAEYKRTCVCETSEREQANELLPHVSGSACKECGSALVHKKEYDVHPYGDNIKYDECIKCGKKHNFKCF